MTSHRPTRLVGVASAAWGIALLAWGDTLYASVSGHRGSSIDVTAVRILGLRYAAQSILQLVRPGHGVKLLSAIDFTHGASMAALAARSTAHRRAATVSMVAAAAIGAAGLLADRDGSRS